MASAVGRSQACQANNHQVGHVAIALPCIVHPTLAQVLTSHLLLLLECVSITANHQSTIQEARASASVSHNPRKAEWRMTYC